MLEITQRDIDYSVGTTHMRGAVFAPLILTSRASVLLIHDAFGLSAEMTDIAIALAEAGHTVFAADVWGERTLPQVEHEIGQLIGGMLAAPQEWMARISAAHAAAGLLPEIDRDNMVALGYCFGGSSALEYLRTGGDLRGVIAIHPGLDLVTYDWSVARPHTDVLVCVGDTDPMATATQRSALCEGMNAAAVEWELSVYSNTVHAFTSRNAEHSPAPHVVKYHPRNAHRAWMSTQRFLSEYDPSLLPTS